MLRRVLLALAAAVATLLVLEGALSLAGQRTLRSLLVRGELEGFRPQWDEERFAAAARTPGWYRAHEDPLVSYTLKAGIDFDVAGGKGQADALGLRRRPGETVASWDLPGAVRLVVLGDSVAFGFGLSDAETLAAQLEEVLGMARGPAEPPVLCRTVAQPGWNQRNEVHFLRDHWDELRADLVLYLPIGNDLASARAVNEAGQVGSAPDLGEPDPWLMVNSDFTVSMKSFLLRQAQKGELDLGEADLGADALQADLSPESTRRYDELARGVLALESFLEAEGSRLVIVQYDRPDPIPILLERLFAAGCRAPVVPFLGEVLRSDTLGSDPHPNALTVHDLALVVARALFEQGLLERGAGVPLPPLSAGIESRLAPAPTAASVAAEAERVRSTARERYSPTIEWATGRGVLQVLGNVSPRGLVGTRLLASVRSGAPVLRIRIEPLAERPDLYPMRVAVEIDGVSREPIELERAGAVTGTYRLEPSARPTVEVRLVPERWAVVRRERLSLLASFQLVSIEVGS